MVLIVSRLPQGFAGGLITPQVSGFIQLLFRREERGKAFGFFGTTVGLRDARDFATAFRHGVVVIVCFIAAALCLAIADAVTKTSDAQREKHA